MTFRERLKIDHPEYVQRYYGGGCLGCPEDYGYEPAGYRERNCDNRHDACWDREMPENNKGETTMKKIYHVITNIQQSPFCQGKTFTFNDQCGYFLIDTSDGMPDPMFVFYKNAEDAKAGKDVLGMIPFDKVSAIYVKEESEKEK